MAYTLEQSTAYKTMPAATDWIYTVLSNLNTQYKFKYLVQVYGGSTGTTYLGLFKFSPNSTGSGVINISNILEQYVASDNLGSIYTLVESSFKGVDNVAGSECPIHCIDNLSLNTYAVQQITLKFGMEYANTPNVAPNTYLNNQTVSGLVTFNGVAYNNEGDYVSGNYGINLSDWNSNNFYPLNTSSKFLTDAPTNSQFIGDNDYGTLAFLTGKFPDLPSSAYPLPDSYQVRFFDDTNTFISAVTTDFNGNGGFVPPVPFLQFSECNLQYLGIGIANFRGAGITVPTNWNSYTVILIEDLNTVTDTYTYFKQNADCKGFEKIRLTWLNKYGVWDYYNFTKKNTKTTDIKRTVFNKVKGNWNGDKFIKYGYQRGSTTLNNSALETMSLNSDWFRSDEEAAWIEQLFISPEVYILNGFDATDTAPADFGKYMIPVTVTSKSYDKFTEANDKVAQYNIDIEYAIDKRIQRG